MKLTKAQKACLKRVAGVRCYGTIDSYRPAVALLAAGLIERGTSDANGFTYWRLTEAGKAAQAGSEATK